MYREEKVKGQEWEEECRIERKELPHPKSHPLLVAMGNITVCIYWLALHNNVWCVSITGREICVGCG